MRLQLIDLKKTFSDSARQAAAEARKGKHEGGDVEKEGKGQGNAFSKENLDNQARDRANQTVAKWKQDAESRQADIAKRANEPAGEAKRKLSAAIARRKAARDSFFGSKHGEPGEVAKREEYHAAEEEHRRALGARRLQTSTSRMAASDEGHVGAEPSQKTHPEAVAELKSAVANTRGGKYLGTMTGPNGVEGHRLELTHEHSGSYGRSSFDATYHHEPGARGEHVVDTGAGRARSHSAYGAIQKAKSMMRRS